MYFTTNKINTDSLENENKYGSITSFSLIILGILLLLFSAFTYDNITLFLIGIVPGIILIIVGFYLLNRIVKALRFYNYYFAGYNNLQSLSDIYMVSKSSLKQTLESYVESGLIKNFIIDDFENIIFTNDISKDNPYAKELSIESMGNSTSKKISHLTCDNTKNIIKNEDEIAEQIAVKYKDLNQDDDLSNKKEIDPAKQIEEWKKYLLVISRAESDFKSEDISFSLYELNKTLKKLLIYLDNHKEKTSEVKKLMDFHLPSSFKLIDSYKELSKSGIKSFSVNKTKEDIVSAIDKINEAFVGVLEDLYNDTAIDVSADIKVLKMMLAREGFLDRDVFKIKK